jgi:hypothetical protein
MADSMQRVSILNYSFFQVSQDIIPLAIYAVIATSIALLLFSKIEKVEEIS